MVFVCILFLNTDYISGVNTVCLSLWIPMILNISVSMHQHLINAYGRDMQIILRKLEVKGTLSFSMNVNV